ncbi:MAG: hypothetical protein AB1352_02090 [Patescibacteria group bacterium]
MPPQLHKRLSDDTVKSVLAKYAAKEITAKEAMRYLNIGRTMLFHLSREYQHDPDHFTVIYERTNPRRRIDAAIEENILKELKTEKEKIIDNPKVVTKRYNYSYIKQLLADKYDQQVSLPTIISRARDAEYWKPKPPKKIHDREVVTNYAGELIQHDSSHHLWAPDGNVKWYLITSLDDYSRAILYADFVLTETTWTHISSAERLILRYGLPHSYYVDQLRVFRYVKDRDKNNPWAVYQKFTDDVDPQWKQVMKECGVEVIYALSPQAKGKVERPYEWLQDHLVKTCVREGVTAIEPARKILQREVWAYNYKRVHSTTGEIPMIRFQNALREGKTLFRPFRIPQPYQSVKDLFCMRIKRTVDPYRKVSLQGFTLKVPNVYPREEVEMRLYPDPKTSLVEVRFWHEGTFMDAQRVKHDDLPIVHF